MPSLLRLPFVSVVAGLFALGGAPAWSVASGANLGHAPDFTLVTLDGQDISRASLQGKVVVINFWATWCPDCMNALPGYIALQNRFGAEEDFVFLAVSLDERPADFVRDFAAKKGINYRVAMGDKALATAFGGIAEIPTTFVLDRTGAIRFKQGGAIAYEEFAELLRSLL